MRRRLVIFGMVVLVVAAGAYTAYWHVTAGILERIVADWAEGRRAEGYRVEIAEPVVTGFPFAFRMALGEPLIEAPAAAGGWRWHGPALNAEAKITNPWHILFAVPGRHVWTAPLPEGAAQSSTAEARAADGEVVLIPRGGLDRASLSLAGVTLKAPAQGLLTLDRAVITFVPAPADAAGAGEPQTTLSAVLEGIGLPPGQAPLEGRLDRLELEALVRGLIPAGPPARALRAWRDAGGVVEARRFAAAWAPLEISGDGTFALDKDMQPMGAMSTAIRGLDETVEKLADAGVIGRKQARFASVAAAALAKPAADGRSEVRVPLTVQDRYVMIGPVKLFRLPRIVWSGEAPAGAGES